MFNYQTRLGENIRKNAFFLRLLPLLGCLFYFSDIPYAILHERLAKHGTMNAFFLLFGCATTLILLADYWVKIGAEKTSFSARKKVYAIVVTLFALLMRVSLFDYESSDYTDALSKWYEQLQKKGGFATFKNEYNSPYLYLLAIFSYLPVHKLYAIKAVSVVFDFFAAFWASRIVRLRYGRESFADLSAYTAVLFMPTMLANGSFWAQCDAIYTSFLLAAVYFFLKNEAISTRKAGLFFVLFFSFSFIFKLQAIFFVLPLCWLYLRGKIQLSYFFILPFVWFMSIFPNYLLGREMLDLLLIYGHQMLYFPLLTLNAPNIYQFFPAAQYADLYKAGLIWTISACVFWAIFLYEKARDININPENLLTISLISLLLLPFLLPKMHERYFFGADLFSVVWVFFYPKKWYVSVLIVSASFLSYLPFLFGSELFPMWIPALMMLCATGLTTAVFVRRLREDSKIRP